ncbi:MAG: sodium:proton antiporter [bacterium]|nr:sodium:proton antiporter [bacterium]
MELLEANVALTIALALVGGVSAQILARHLRIPGIVLLLGMGALMGPDLLGVIDPSVLGGALQTLVGFAVAVILFEGALNLEIKRLRRESQTLRQLVIWGAIVTAVGAALAAHFVMDWDWNQAILFGTLVIVTGPTVITPIVRRVRLKHSVGTILEAEGVLIDPIGAIIAIVALDIVIHPSSASFFVGLLSIILRLGAGALIGLASGFALALMLRPKKLIPEGLGNIFVLASVWAIFHISNALMHESGIMAVTAAGLVVGNTHARISRDLAEFKEQLTVMLIAMLFVLLAADIRFDDIRALGVEGLITVAILIFVVRPLNIAVGTAGSGLKLNERAFLAWMAPRGIVAAAVASFFAIELSAAGIDGGTQLRAMVFLVIAVTVLLSGLSSGPVAGLLGVRRKSDQGYAILGSTELGLTLAKALKDGGKEVTIIDSNADAIHQAQEMGLNVVFGNALEERTLYRARLDELSGCIGLTPNEEVNLLFATKAKEEFKVGKLLVATHLKDGHVEPEMIHDAGASHLFGRAQDINLWSLRIKRKLTRIETWRHTKKSEENEEGRPWMIESIERTLFALVISRSGRAYPIDEETKLKQGDLVTFLLFEEEREKATAWFSGQGWVYERIEEIESNQELS